MTAHELMPPDRICPACGYDLRGGGSVNCPECGLAVADMVSGQIAWEERGRLGYVSAFFRTTVTATFRHKKFAAAIQRPVDVASARWYRRVVILIVTVTAICVQAAMLIEDWRLKRGPMDDLKIGVDVSHSWVMLPIAGLAFAPTIGIGTLVMLCISTAVAPWFRVFSRPQWWQNRAMAVSFYACGPLVWLVVPAGLAIALLILAGGNVTANDGQFETLGTALGILFSVTSVFVAVMMLAGPVRMSGVVCGGGRGRAVMVAGGVLVQWGLGIVVGLGIVPTAIGLAYLMVSSLFV